jgi:hypothetical protein
MRLSHGSFIEKEARTLNSNGHLAGCIECFPGRQADRKRISRLNRKNLGGIGKANADGRLSRPDDRREYRYPTNKQKPKARAMSYTPHQTLLPPEEEIEDQTSNHTDNDTGRERKVKRHIIPFDDKIAGQPAEPSPSPLGI